MTQPETIKVGQLEITYLIDGAEKGTMGVFELRVPPSSNVPPTHSHSLIEECVYVLEGVLRYSVESTTKDLGPGESMYTPMSSIHGFSNPFDMPVRALIVLTPDLGAQYFRDVGAIVNAGSPTKQAELFEVMSRYGLVASLPSSPSPARV